VKPAAIEAELTELRCDAAGDHAGVRTYIVNLIAFAGSAEIAAETAQAIANSHHHRPSRALVTRAVRGTERVAAEASVFCAQPPEGPGPVLVCSELVRLEGPDDTDALANMVASLLLPDLPAFLVWLAPPAFDTPIFRRLSALATRIVTDSTRFPETLDRLPSLASNADRVVTDLAWTKITGWREVVAALFDPPAHAAMLQSLKKISIQHVAGSDAQARLLAGWLSSCTGTKPTVALKALERKDMRAGSLIAVELQCGEERFAVERPEAGVAVTTSPQMPTGRLALRVPPFEELLGEELEFLAHDHAFDEALGALARPKPKPKPRKRPTKRSSG